MEAKWNMRAQDQETAQTSCEESAETRSPRRIAMYCTDCIRCEKVYLEGGILKYLEETPASESLWEGECFVFDKRVAVGHVLKQGSFRFCYACKKPVKLQTWSPHCGKKACHALIVFMGNLRLRNPELELDMNSFYIGESLVVQIKGGLSPHLVNNETQSFLKGPTTLLSSQLYKLEVHASF